MNFPSAVSGDHGRGAVRGSSPVLLCGLLLAFLCIAVVGCAAGGGEQGACAAPAPRIEAVPAKAAPSEPFELRGENFADRYYCNDVGSDGSQDEPARGVAEQGIPVEFVQGERTWELTTLDSDENLSFVTSLEVPADAEPGQAVVRATNRNYGSTETSFSVDTSP